MPAKNDRSGLLKNKRLRDIGDGNNLIVEICMSPPAALRRETNNHTLPALSLSLRLFLFDSSSSIFIEGIHVDAGPEKSISDTAAQAVRDLGLPANFKIEHIWMVFASSLDPCSDV
jgi:hypothetical protein